LSIPEAPAATDTERILANQERILERQEALITATNALGANVQWIIDNVQGIFQMFSNPQFMAQLPGMMGGMGNGGE
jgi:hypothetical protein